MVLAGCHCLKRSLSNLWDGMAVKASTVFLRPEPTRSGGGDRAYALGESKLRPRPTKCISLAIRWCQPALSNECCGASSSHRACSRSHPVSLRYREDSRARSAGRMPSREKALRWSCVARRCCRRSDRQSGQSSSTARTT